VLVDGQRSARHDRDPFGGGGEVALEAPPLERVAEPARKAGLEVEFSGGVIITSTSGQDYGDVIGLIIAFIVLFIVFALAAFILAPATGA